jgi:hypothetical protein
VLNATNPGLFAVDDDYDANHASNGISRVLAYGELNRNQYTESGMLRSDPYDPITTDPAEFAMATWHCATGPVMSPPYVDRTDPLILSARLCRNLFDASLEATVDLITPPPPELRRLHDFNGWQYQHGQANGSGYFAEPSEEARTRRPTLLPTAKIVLPLPADRLHTPLDAPARLTSRDMKAAVHAVIDILNETLAPVLNALHGGGSR